MKLNFLLLSFSLAYCILTAIFLISYLTISCTCPYCSTSLPLPLAPSYCLAPSSSATVNFSRSILRTYLASRKSSSLLNSASFSFIRRHLARRRYVLYSLLTRPYMSPRIETSKFRVIMFSKRVVKIWKVSYTKELRVSE
jgi:hypothetical protein